MYVHVLIHLYVSVDVHLRVHVREHVHVHVHVSVYVLVLNLENKQKHMNLDNTISMQKKNVCTKVILSTIDMKKICFKITFKKCRLQIIKRDVLHGGMARYSAI